MSIDERMALQGKSVAVAGGGGGGIGSAICGLLAEAGARVAVLDVKPEALDLTDEFLEGTAGPHAKIVCDVRDPQAVEAAIKQTAELGPFHGLVHVAGGIWPDQWAPLLKTDLDVYDRVVELNLRSQLITATAAARRLEEQGQGGSIVQIASIVGLSGMPFGVPYATAKAGLLGLMRTAAMEWGRFGVRVNAVAPGAIRTPKALRGRSADAPAETQAELTSVPITRGGRPNDIAGAVLFLMSELGSFVTGQVLAVDGGSSIRPSYIDADNIPVAVVNYELRDRLLAD
jgi:NAD(P)-dependent dehydrogenase (short-subunit alcohol dehydrogenase family)